MKLTGILVAFSMAARAQSPAFEVASIKPADPAHLGGARRTCPQGGPGTSDPGRITCEAVTLRNMIMIAYGLKTYQLAAPEWTGSAMFDLVAKLPEGAARGQIPEMWQQLLADRFKLTVHRETRDMPIYAVTVAKGGLKMAEASEQDPPKGRDGFELGANSMHMHMSRGNIAGLIIVLGIAADRPVIDATGLTGRYAMDFEFQRQDLTIDAPAGPPFPTMAQALEEKLGLKLDSRKGPIEMVVIDHLEKAPTAN